MSVDPQQQFQQQDPQKTDINALKYALDQWEVYACENLSEGMRKAFMQMFDRAANLVDKKNSKDNQLAAFQRELQRIPEMTTGQLTQLLQDVSSFFDKDFNLKKTIKNIFLHRTMIASGIRPQSKANQRFDVPLPNPETLIHRAMSISAVSLFQWPSLFDRSPKTNTEENRLKKFNKVQSIIESSINKAIVQLMPYGELQDAYLGDAQNPGQSQGQPVPPPAANVPQPVEEVIPPQSKQTEVLPQQQQQPEYDPESKAGFKTSSSKHSGKFQSGKKQQDNSDEEDDEDDDESGSGSGSDDDNDDQDTESQGDDQTEDEEPQPQKQKQNNKRKLEPGPKHSSSKKSDKKARKF